MHRIRLVTLILIGASILCAVCVRLGQTQSGGLRRITNTSEEAININPSISGDGRIVAFESTEDLAAVGGSDHFRAIRATIDVDPATFVQMGGTRAVTPAISQDGSRIAFASKDDPLGTNGDGNSEIFLFDGTRLRQVTNTSPGSLANRTLHGNFQPSISDDGRFIAFSSNRDLAAQNGDGNLEIFLHDATSGSFSQLTSSSGTVGFSDAKISGNGNVVAYVRDNGLSASTDRDLMSQPRTGGAATVLATAVPSLALTYGRAISDDGTRLVYSSQTATNTTQVFLYDGRGAAGVRQITSLGARVTEVPLHPSISGDGARLSFATRRNVNGGNSDGSVELYLYDLPTATFSKITNSPAGATADVVSSLNDDGSVVAFNFPRLLSGAVSNADLANDSEIYATGTPARPPFGSLTVLNGASLGNEPAANKAVAPDSIAVARGALLANSTQQAQRLANGAFPTSVGGTTVTVNGRPAQIFFVSGTQVNFLVPPETEIGTAEVIVTNSEGFPSRGAVTTLRSAPGVFTKSGDGTGEALVLNSDTLQEGPFDPSNGNLRLTIFATGARNATQLSVTIGGQAVTPELVLASPEMPGLDEIHLRAPASLKGAGVVTLSTESDGRESNPSSARFAGGEMLINEVLADPPGAAPTDLIGDANRDGVRSASDDEFVELVNATSRDIDVSGYQLLARASGAGSDTLRHTFAAGTIVPARTAVVIFGGGGPNPGDPAFGAALILKASTGGLSLSNTAGIVTLRDSAGAVANIFEYGGATGLSGGSNQSLTRSPDFTGAFTGHATADGSGGRLFSPGNHVDGTPFATIPIARIDLSPLSPAIDAGAKQQFTARAFDAANQEVTGVTFFWQSSNTSVATIDQNGLATSSTAGTTQITAGGRGIQSAPTTLTVRAVERVLTRIDVTPNPATIPVSGAQQFTAKGIDQFGNEIAGLTFVWESTATSVATIDQNGLANGLAPGQSTIKATTQNVTGSAVLNVTPPTVIVNEVLADPPPGADGDANHDGTRDGAQDEFVELVNSTNAAMDLSGWTLRTHSTTSTTETVRHTFAAGTGLPAGEAIVVFGGGTFDPANPLFGCSQVVKTSSSGLSLTNGGLTILIRDATGNLVTTLSYGGSTGLNGDNEQSLTRSPDISGGFVLHTTPVASSGRRFSPGLKLDGTPFGNCPGHPASVTIAPASTTANVGQATTFTAQAFDQFGRAMIGVPITFASDNTTVATIDSTTPNPMTGVFTASVGAHNPGVAQITASANDGTTSATSTQATLTVSGPALSINDVSLNEGNSGPTTFTFTVGLSEPAGPGGVRFDIATQDATATIANGDYLARSLTNQTIAAGAQTYSFDVTVNGDATIEPNETFLVGLTNVSGASVTKGQGTGTLLNDDSPTLNVNDISASEGNSGTTTFTFTVSSTLPAPAGGITFDIATANGTASSASDYDLRQVASASIPAGQSSYTFDVTVHGDTLVETNETFSVNVSNVSANAAAGDAQGLGTIQNDDTPAIVISQLYGGGGNSGATFKHDFIEIYNRGTTIVDLAGWSVQYNSATGTGSWSVTPLCPSGPCLIQPGRYFLVQEDQGSGGTLDLPTPDAIGTIAMTTGAGKVAVSSSTTPLSGGCPASANILDLVGYGSTASCFEGSGPANAPGNATADFRKAGGCVDTNDNANDFFVAQPNPRNSAAPVGDCKPEITINDVTVTENNSGTVSATFTVSLAAASAQTVTVDFATADGTAASPADYQTNNGPLTFNPGDLTGTITILVNGDTLDEAAETFFVNLTNATNAVILDNQGQGTINDNDPAPSLSIGDVSVTEGDSGTTSATFTVSLSAASGQIVTVNYATADNTATAGSDYEATSGALTFNPSETSKTLTVTVNGDTTFEPDETLFVNLSGATNASISDNQAVGTITNDDPAPPVPTFSINDVTVTEGNSGTTTATFTVTLSLASGSVVTVDYATADATATLAGSDYQSATGTLNFGMGETSKQISVTINGDTLVENDETFVVNLTNATGGSIIGDNQGVGTIQNDDTPAIVISQLYGGGGNSGATFKHDFIEIYNRGTTTVDLAGWSVQYNSATGTGTWSVTPLCPSGPCLIQPGRYFLVQEDQGSGGTVDLPTPDAIGTIAMTTGAGKVAVSSSTTPLSGGCPSSASILDIVGYGAAAGCFEGSGPANAPGNATADFRKAGGCVDTNDNASDFLIAQPNPRNSAAPVGDCKPEITINDVTVTENNSGTVSATFTVSLAAASAQTVTVDFATADGTAASPADYQTNNGPLTFNPGDLTRSVTILVNGDTLDEAAETFFVNLTNATNAVILDNQGQGTITDNDPAPSLSIGDVSIAEGDSGTTSATFTVSLSTASGQTVTVNYATADNTATAGSDYEATSGALTFNPSETSKTLTVNVNGDPTFEPDETVLVNLSGATNASISDNQAVGTITNDDPAPPVPTFSINDVTVVEGDSGTTTATFDVTLSLASGNVVTVDYATADATATLAGSDYQSATGTLTFAIGETSKQISVTINGDTLVENDETFVVNLTNATGGSIIGDNQGVGTIQNDDTPNLVISQVYPGGGLSGASFTNDFIEIYNRGTTTVDFSVIPYSVQFLSTAAATWVKTDLTSGTILPGRYFLIRETSGGANGAALPTPDATGTINLTSTTAGKVALVTGTTLLTGNCPGDDGISPFNPLGANVADFVGYGGTAATVNHCYEGSGPAAFTSGNNTIADYRKAGGCTDTNDNAGDLFAFTPSPRNSSSPTNNCAGFTPSLSINDVSVTEGNGGAVTATFTVSLSAPAQGADVTFDIATADSSATTADSDYVTNTQLNQIIPAGQTTYTFTVTVNGDTAVEPDQTFLVNVTNVAGATVADGQGAGTIQHDDLPALSIDDVSAVEGGAPGTFTFHVTLSAPAPATVTFDIATADGTAQDDVPASEDNDYQPRSIISQTIAQGSSSFDFDVTINGDAVDEPNETFFVNVTNVLGATVNDGQGLGTIQNDDAPPSLSITDVTQAETNSLTTTFIFTVQLSAPALAGGVTFTVNTADGVTDPAVGGSDYVAIVNGSGSIAQNDSSTTVSVTVNGDTMFEPNETFLVNLTGVTGATVTDGQGLGTITNDDTQPTIAIADASITEGAAGTSLMTFTVTLTGTSQSTVSVNYATADSSATIANSDYDSTSGTLNFVSGDTTETFTVTIHGDTNVEGDEMFLVDLTSPSGATITDNQALGIIFLDDAFSIAAVNTAYSENFDVLAQTGVSATTAAAWTRAESSSTANATYSANNGSTNAGDTYSYGTTGSSDRALGGLRTGTLVPTIGAFYRNDTGSTVTTLQISYTGEEWRLGTVSRTDQLDFQYSTNATSLTTGTWNDVNQLDFLTPNTAATGAKDGNNATNRTAITHTITGLSIATGSTFWIRWTDLDASGADDGLAVDDFSITAGVDTPGLSITDVTAAETHSGTTTFTFNVNLTGPAPPGGVTFTINTADGTTNPANAPSDYAAIINGSGSIAQNGTTTTVNVTVNGDTDIEPDETFFVNLSGVTGATVTDSQALGTITNDDATAASADLSLTKGVSNSTPNIGENVIFTITLNNAGPDPATTVQVKDLLPAGLNYISSTPSQGTYTSGTGIWDIGAVSVASPAATLSITATVATVGAKINTAEVTLSGTPDPNSTPNDGVGDDFASVTVTGASNLVINEIHTQAQASPPANSNDFIELYNKSSLPIDISGLVISYRAGSTTPNTYTVPASTVIGAGAYLIIVNGAITYGVAADLDASSAGFNLTATSGGVKIVLNGVQLDGLAYQTPGNNVSATFAAFSEGTVFTSSTASGQQDYVRSPNGADSGDNATDFRRSGTNSTTVTPKAVNPTITP